MTHNRKPNTRMQEFILGRYVLYCACIIRLLTALFYHTWCLYQHIELCADAVSRHLKRCTIADVGHELWSILWLYHGV